MSTQPNTPTEQKLAALWSEILGVQRVTVDDNFFELGGQSLHATQLLTRIRLVFSANLTFADIFNFPTLRAMAEIIDRAEHTELESLQVTFPERTDKQEIWPLSFAQERLWFLWQLAPGNAAYNIPIAFQLTGKFDRTAFEDSLCILIKNHDVFRTAFESRDGALAAIVQADMSPVIRYVECQQGSWEERFAATLRLLENEANTSFDLMRGPLYRVVVHVLGENMHVVLLHMHHIIFDQWSLGIIARDLSILYNGFREGRRVSLPHGGPTYGQYAQWQRTWIRSVEYRSQLAYWSQHLAGLPVLTLPTDYVRPEAQTFKGASVFRKVTDETISALTDFSVRKSVTPFMTLLTAFTVLLCRYSEQTDFAVGVPIANRNRRESERLVGTLVNTLVFRMNLAGDPTVGQLLQRIHDTALEAYDHQDVPFERLVQEISPWRTQNYQPLVNVLFNVDNVPICPILLDDLEIAPIALDPGTSQFDLTLSVDLDTNRRFVLEYSTDLFSEATASRMADQFVAILESVQRNSAQPISSIEMSDERERNQLCEWQNGPEEPVEHYPLIPDLLMKETLLHPESVAVIDFSGEYSYGELNKRADSVSAQLRSAGITTEDRIGVLCDPTVQLIAGLFGVLRAGGAYVPLDPNYPQTRLLYMVQEAGLKTIAASEKYMKRAKELVDDVLEIDCEAKVPDTHDAQCTILADSIAYVLFTSGSTGKPKGIEVTHGNLRNSTCARVRYYSETPSRFLLLSSVSFDSSVAGIFWTLCYGGTLVLPTRDEQMDPGAIAGLIAKHKITHTLMIPSLYGLVLQDAEETDMSSLRTVTVAGEAPPLHLIRNHFRHLPNTRLFNEYGPTEATVWATVYECSKDEKRRSIPIGRPILNTQTCIVDSSLKPVPVGVRGELLLGGGGVARGYLHRPESIDEKFVRIHGLTKKGDRFYRTGDLGRFLSDGNIEYIGRLDRQTKVRGHRIELQEIEEILRSHPRVRDAVVLLQANELREGMLVAYVVTHKKDARLNADLRTYLKSSLPDFMQPSRFIALDGFPLLPNGKVDLNALPASPAECDLTENDQALPINEMEQCLLDIWSKVLEVPRIGTNDNFFDLGGHSFLAVRLFAELEGIFHRRLPLATLFKAPTIRQLADALAKEEWVAPWSPMVSILKGGTGVPLFLVHPTGGGVLVYHDLARHVGKARPVYALQPVGLDGTEPLLTRLDEIAARYIREIRCVQAHGPYCLGGLSAGGVFAFEMARQLQMSGEQVPVVVIFDTLAPGESSAATRLANLGRELAGLKERLVYHSRNLLVGERRREYIRAKLRTIKRRTTSRLWQMTFSWKKRSFENVSVAKATVLRANAIALKSYLAEPFSGKILLFRTEQKPVGVFPDEYYGWSALARGGVEVHKVAGGHLTMIMEPHVSHIAEILEVVLAREFDSKPSGRTSRVGQ
jgi:amino acid adenylation domain-containing protein